MTPRTVVSALPGSQTVAETIASNPSFQYSRIPVYEENIDDIKGFVLRGDIFQTALENSEKLLTDICRPIVVMLGDVTLHTMFERMMDESTHIALVVDEYGGTEGIVTMEDFIETLLGLEIVDEEDTVEDLQEMAREQWKARARRTGLITDQQPSKDQDQSSPQERAEQRPSEL